jgi:hypothetical protein
MAPPSGIVFAAFCLAAAAGLQQESACTIGLPTQIRPECLAAKFGDISLKVKGDLVFAEPFDGCTAQSEGALEGKILFAGRGVCGFAAKAENAQKAGGVASVGLAI